LGTESLAHENSAPFQVVIPLLTKPRSDYHLINQIQTNHAYINVPNTEDPEPIIYRNAVNGPESREWNQVMKEEFNSFIDNNTWKLLLLPNGRKALGGKWVYKRKKVVNLLDNSNTRYKVRWVAKGFL
jgi:hypothetical protein